MSTPADSTTMVSTTCMLPSEFTVMRESNERIPSVWAPAGAASSKARTHAIKKFFMESMIDYNSACTQPEGKNWRGSGLAHRRGLVRAHPADDHFRAIVILSAHGTAGHAAQHRNLPGMRES